MTINKTATAGQNISFQNDIEAEFKWGKVNETEKTGKNIEEMTLVFKIKM